jgi:hypothetical protein
MHKTIAMQGKPVYIHNVLGFGRGFIANVAIMVHLRTENNRMIARTGM